jgi:hypothetical protein
MPATETQSLLDIVDTYVAYKVADTLRARANRTPPSRTMDEAVDPLELSRRHVLAVIQDAQSAAERGRIAETILQTWNDSTDFIQADFNDNRLIQSGITTTLFRGDIIREEVFALRAEVERLKGLSVTHILLEVVPGDEGNGEEVYARSIADVEAKLSKMGSDLEGWQLGIKRLHLMVEALDTTKSKVQGLEPTLDPLMESMTGSIGEPPTLLAAAETLRHALGNLLQTYVPPTEWAKWLAVREVADRSMREQRMLGAMPKGTDSHIVRSDDMPTSRTERQLRRLLCLARHSAAGSSPYMDDGEASWGGSDGHRPIDYMRETPEAIELAWREHGIRQWRAHQEFKETTPEN